MLDLVSDSVLAPFVRLVTARPVHVPRLRCAREPCPATTARCLRPLPEARPLAAPGTIVLGGAIKSVGGLGFGVDYSQTCDRGRVASARLPALLALAFP